MAHLGAPCFNCKLPMTWYNTCFSNDVYLLVKNYEGKPLCNVCIKTLTTQSTDGKKTAIPEPNNEHKVSNVKSVPAPAKVLKQCYQCSGLGKQYVHRYQPMERQFACSLCGGSGWRYT
jgi:hypothetical protein